MANVVKYVPAGSNYNPHTDSDVGTVVSYNSSTGRVEFKDIDFNALGALLGLTKPFTFKDCVLSPNVNPNAIFKPSTSAPYTLADFAGYQHKWELSTIQATCSITHSTPSPHYIIQEGNMYVGKYQVTMFKNSSSYAPNVASIRVRYDIYAIVITLILGVPYITYAKVGSEFFMVNTSTSMYLNDNAQFSFAKSSNFATSNSFRFGPFNMELLDAAGRVVQTEEIGTHRDLVYKY